MDNSLDDNEEYFYKIRGKNSSGAGQFSGIVSARTEIDHPAQIPSLTATPYNSTQIKLTVVLPTDTGGVPLQGIRFERSLLPSSGFSTIVQNTGNLNTEYTDTGLDTNTPYYYRAFAINTDGKESLIPSITSSAIPIYDSPTNLTVTSENENTVARLNWTAPVDINSLSVQKYKIFRRLAGSGSFALLAEILGDGTTYDDNTVAGNKVYEYYVIAVIDGEETPQSATSSVTIPIRAPTAPIGLTATTKSDNKIDLTWDTPQDDGGSPLVGNILSYSKDSNFANATDVDLELVNSHSMTGLDPDTQYYFKIIAKNALYTGAESTIANSTTFKILFGESAIDITIPEGQTETIGDKEYRNIINNGTLICTAAIIRAESYTEGENGKIVVDNTGCPGGIKGTSSPGAGGAGGPWDTRTPQPGSPATLTPNTNAVSCTDLSTMSGIIDDSLSVDTFTTEFKNNITGGKGSDGIPAQSSGSGGSGGYGGSFTQFLNAVREAYNGGRGGDGGLAAQGVDGVRGGGKLALYIRNIISGITIIAKGNDGNDGNKGTGDAGDDGTVYYSVGIETIPYLGAPSNGVKGADATANGTLGSKGSQGGLVILVYESITPNNSVIDTFDDGLDGWTDNSTPNYSLTHDTEHGGSAKIAEISAEGAERGSMTKEFDVSDIVDVLSFDYRAKSDSESSYITNLKLRIKDVSSNSIIYSENIVHGGTLDTQWQKYSKDISSVVSGVDRIKVEIWLLDGWSQNYNQTIWVDNFSLSRGTDTPVISVDVSGGLGGFGDR